MLIALGAAVGPARADEPAAKAKNELEVFGGVSLLDASRSTERTASLPGFGGFFPPVFPNRPNLPTLPPLSFQIQTGTSIGNSALIGFRYSRSIKSRLWAEADLQVAPSHDLEASGGVCFEGRCLGTGDIARGGGRRVPDLSDLDLDLGRSRPVAAWHYGAGLAYELTGGDVRPFLKLGAGAVSWSGAGEASTDFVLRFGAGLKVTFGRVGFRVEGVDYFVPDLSVNGKSEHDIHVTGGFLVHF
jgi:hypothetical protein